ncbi:MAG: glutamate-5-semialdehyde dehydrogenase [Sphaerochaetaceae bacterium]|nr:glutamate-5-semialdehyde dehydrogenase [Sphaerochaetaceae bacterium]MDC7238332.1 glutamate-5-semialdehyde dehydrogenase [Sphaerochaetaceae bacterium]MDC7251097.1 glutamate-5-semialdehyde dehydrogenase [Sphaerochaetaceae bacterium]
MNTKAILENKIKDLRKNIVKLSSSSNETRNEALNLIKEGLIRDKELIFKANKLDLIAAKEANLSSPIISRLKFDEKKLNSSVSGLEQVMNQKDPVGDVLEKRKLDDDLILEKVSFPLGVIGMIFESRPDALVQIVSLCLKSGNGIVLKGGKESINTNRALIESIKKSLEKSPLKSFWVILIESHQDVDTLLTMEGYIDLLIPRGSNSFVSYVMNNSKIPVMGHSDGLCSIYVDESVDIDKAALVCYDSKTQYPSACNAVETILINKNIAKTFLPKLKKELDKKNVIIHGDETVCSLIDCIKATEEDWDSEYLDYEVAIKVVENVDQAIDHIAKHGSSHTDAILSKNEKNIEKFFNSVDSADVFCNCSTRFADGYRFGLGAEVGISTSKLHARGPVGVKGLMSTKYLLRGNNQIVEDYSTNKKSFKHVEL